MDEGLTLNRTESVGAVTAKPSRPWIAILELIVGIYAAAIVPGQLFSL
jgi:hypothetical protein